MLVKRGVRGHASSAMSQQAKPRNKLGELLDSAKTDSEEEWLDIALGTGLSPSTIQSWVNGNTKQPPLRPIAHLARYLKIDPAALLDAALANYSPPISRGAGAAARREALAALEAGEEVALDAEAAAHRGREKDDPKRRRSA